MAGTSAVIAGRFYSVKVNGVPVQEAMKSLIRMQLKVLENAAKIALFKSEKHYRR